MWTNSVGGNGGHQHIGFGGNFNNLSLVGASGRSGQCLDQISFKFVNIYTGQFYSTPTFGGNGGQPFQINVPHGQWVTNVWVRTNGHVLTGLDFDLNGGGKAGSVGSNIGNWHCIPTNGKRIANVMMRTGTLVDNLQFYLI